MRRIAAVSRALGNKVKFIKVGFWSAIYLYTDTYAIYHRPTFPRRGCALYRSTGLGEKHDPSSSA